MKLKYIFVGLLFITMVMCAGCISSGNSSDVEEKYNFVGNWTCKVSDNSGIILLLKNDGTAHYMGIFYEKGDVSLKEYGVDSPIANATYHFTLQEIGLNKYAVTTIDSTLITYDGVRYSSTPEEQPDVYFCDLTLKSDDKMVMTLNGFDFTLKRHS